MRKIFAFLCISMLAMVAVQAQTDTAIYKTLAAEIRHKYAPDKRSVYFNTTIKPDTIYVESTSEAALSAFKAAVENQHGLVLSEHILPAQSLKGLIYGVANLSVTNNRTAPRNAAEMVTQMLMGTPVQILKKEGPYFLVRTPDGYLSYTDPQAVYLMDQPAFKKWQQAEKIVFTEDLGHAYSESSVNSQRVSDLVAGNILELLGANRNFYKVVFPDHRIGYVVKNEATPYKKWISRPNPNAAQILTTAKTMMGVPYLWGGTSVKGVDCSGFVKTSFFLNGVIIPRDASQQALTGTNVDIMDGDSLNLDKCMRNLQPGDLLFFSAAKRKGIADGKITHTAIYIGKGAFIQAAGMVRISSLLPEGANYDGRQVPTLVCAKRFLTNIGVPGIERISDHSWYSGN